jgi:hypothetical protein
MGETEMFDEITDEKVAPPGAKIVFGSLFSGE